VSGQQPSDELRILQTLNTPEVRKDPRNDTIHVLEYITFDGLVFAIMPRWPPAFDLDFETVGELVHILDVYLEYFVFLHENRIAHCDFVPQNTGVNVIVDVNRRFAEGFRDPVMTKYAVYDFGHSLIYPADTDIQDVRDTRYYGRTDPFSETLNPFQLDMLLVGETLQAVVRVIEHDVPAIGPFFDLLVTEDAERRLTAPQAFNMFQQIRAGIGASELRRKVIGRYWRKGGTIETKSKHPYVKHLGLAFNPDFIL